ncbi:MAG TPA: MarR family winged helix-turn-helix transcriptional regulator [Acetobacteraceae bacterium]|nr:MarR family winged helix-turn-helix transcriptional regulator [Acetobacteraceae bacterium]
MEDLYRMPGHLVRRVQQISSALFAEECGAFDITSVQFAALFAIRANPDVDATRLSHLIAFDRSTLGDVLERVEAKGWIVRSSSPTDRRVKLLRLTPDGERLLERVMPAVQRVQERLLAPLPAADRAAMVRMLAEIGQVHNEVTPAPLRVVAQR